MNDQALEKLTTSSRRAALISIFGVVIVIISLMYAAFKLASTEQQANEFKRKNDELQRELNSQTNRESLREYNLFINDLVKSSKSSAQLRTTMEDVKLAIEQVHRGEYSQSAKTLDKAMVSFGEHPYLLNLKGWSLLSAQQPIDAAVAFEKATSVRADYGWGFYDLARAQCESGNFPNADQALKKALQLDNKLAELLKSDVPFSRVCASILVK